jgi:hypothetical protein
MKRNQLIKLESSTASGTAIDARPSFVGISYKVTDWVSFKPMMTQTIRTLTLGALAVRA